VRKILLVAVPLVLLAVAGGVLAYLAFFQSPTKGHLDTALNGITIVGPASPIAPPKIKPKPHHRAVVVDAPCWLNFGGDPQRTLARVHIDLGKPTRSIWARALHSYIEYPPSYCQGKLYVNTFGGRTYAIDARTGHVIWVKQGPGPEPSTPAIAGDRLIVSSKAGTVTALARSNGKQLWRFRDVGARIESSAVVIGGTAYFGATDGRMFAVRVSDGHVEWAYQTGGRINSSPSVIGNRLFITTYAGSILALNRHNGHRIWITYVKRDYVLYESFYASASTDGTRLFTISRSGTVVALRASDGAILWTHALNTTGYSTPAIAHGRVIVGDFNGTLHCYQASTGNQLWQTYVGGRILGPAVVVGPLVFFSTLETETYGVRLSDGKIVWRVGMGKYSPGIATAQHYYFSLNGMLIAYKGTPAAKVRGMAGAAAATKASGVTHGWQRSRR
jgi:outer membrane protein assembly factor BamB